MKVVASCYQRIVRYSFYNLIRSKTYTYISTSKGYIYSLQFALARVEVLFVPDFKRTGTFQTAPIFPTGAVPMR